MKNILAIGDSLIKGNPNPEEGGWVGRLFHHRRISAIATLANLAEGGATTEDVLELIEEVLATNQYSGFVLGIGANDSRIRDSLGSTNEVPLEQFSSNLHGILKRLSNSQAEGIFLVTPLPVVERLSDPLKPDKRYQNRWIERYRAAMISEAQQHPRVTLFDPHALWSDYSEKKLMKLLVDGVHPSSKGYALLSKQAYRPFKEWIQRDL